MGPASQVGSTWRAQEGRSLLWDLAAEGPRGVGFSWREMGRWGPVWGTEPRGDMSWKQDGPWVCIQGKLRARGGGQ